VSTAILNKFFSELEACGGELCCNWLLLCPTDIFSVRYPPFTDKKLGMLSWLVKKNPKSNKVLLSFFPIVIVGILLGILFKVS